MRAVGGALLGAMVGNAGMGAAIGGEGGLTGYISTASPRKPSRRPSSKAASRVANPEGRRLVVRTAGPSQSLAPLASVYCANTMSLLPSHSD